MNRRACVCFATAGVFLLPVSVGARHPAPSGIRFSYVLPQTLTLHEPVCLVSTISNETSDTAQIDLGQDRKGAYVLAVTQPSGVKIDLPPHSHEGISRLSTLVLEPGQFYTQTLVLNEWYAFGTPGRYHVQVRLIHPALVGASSTQVADPGFQADIEIQPRSAQRLEATLNELTRRIEDSASYEQAAEAATTLRYVTDPLAVPYLEKALQSGKAIEPIAIAGLEGIADGAAVAALISSLRSTNSDVSTLAQAALRRIQQQTSEPTLKEQIRIPVQGAPRGS